MACLFAADAAGSHVGPIAILNGNTVVIYAPECLLVRERKPVEIVRRYRLAASYAALGLLTCVACVVATSGCRTVPMTGRKQVMLTPESTEIRMGADAYRELLADETLSTNEEAVAMVERVGQRIAAVADRDDFDWEFTLISGPTKNAFCLPGGKVAIYEGILPVCDSEAGLAVVMSHEIAHALARHGGERTNQQMMVSGAGALLSMGTKNVDEKKKQILLASYGAVSQYGVVLPYSRKHESEADAIGLKLMAKAGYDPSEAPHFWDRFSQESGPKPPAFFSTHPSDARRAADLREQLPASLALYKAAPQQFDLGDPIPEIRLASHAETNESQPIQSAAATE